MVGRKQGRRKGQELVERGKEGALGMALHGQACDAGQEEPKPTGDFQSAETKSVLPKLIPSQACYSHLFPQKLPKARATGTH